MAYFPPYQAISSAPPINPLAPNWGSALNSPMFQGYEGGAPLPSYLQPPLTVPSAIPNTPAASSLFSQLSNPATGAKIGPLAEEVTPAATSRLGSLLSGRLGTFAKAAAIPVGLTVAGSMLEDPNNPGSARDVIGHSLSTGGTTAGLGTLASGLGLTVGGVGGLPIVAGAAAGGIGGSLINSALRSGSGTDFGPFHWHGQEPHATSFMGENPQGDHLIGVALNLFQQGDISKEDFSTIMKQAQVGMQLAGDDKKAQAAVVDSLGGMVSQAAQLQIQRAAETKANATSAHDRLLQQVAIAKLMQPEINQINEGSRGLAESIAASRANLSPQFQPFADMLSRNAIAGGHRQAAALQASTLALPQVQALIASINQQNALQQAANYQAAKQASASGTGTSLTDLLNPQQAVSVAGAGGASGPLG